MAEYQIFADVTADHTGEMMAGLPPVEMIPMQVEIGGVNYTYGPDGDLSEKVFYDLQREGKFASTTQIPPAAFAAWFEPVLKAGRDVIYFPLTAGLSGTFQSAQMCMEELREQYPDRKLLCVDTCCASIGQGFLLRELARKQQEGLSIEELAAWAGENGGKVCHWFTVDVFDHLKHGGRVSAAVAVVGTALQIKPMLRVDGEGRLSVTDKPRGHKKALAAKVAKIREGWTPEMGKTVVIGHGDDLASAEELRDEVLAVCPDAEIFLVPIDPIIGAHTGPGMLALAYWGNNR